MSQSIFASVDTYIGKLFATEDEALLAIEPSLEKAGLQQMSISPVQGKMLQVLALLCNARNILEIGTFAGYSTIWMARALPEGGRLITIEYDPVHAGIARQNLDNAGVGSKVSIRTGKALEVLQQLENEGAGPFDMIFIDADKPPYAEYLQLALQLSRPGTLIVADNVVRGGRVMDKGDSADERVKGVQRFNEMLAAEPGVAATILQTVGVKEHDGMAIAVVK